MCVPYRRSRRSGVSELNMYSLKDKDTRGNEEFSGGVL